LGGFGGVSLNAYGREQRSTEKGSPRNGRRKEGKSFCERPNPVPTHGHRVRLSQMVIRGMDVK